MKIMKKILLSSVLIVSFIGYALFASRNQDAATSSVAQTVLPANTQTVPTSSQTASTNDGSSLASNNQKYKDGSYIGPAVFNGHGTVQVKAVITGGKITNVVFVQVPNDSTSAQVNAPAMPQLKSEAIAAQSAKVSGVSGASDTSAAFIESLGAALAQASA